MPPEKQGTISISEAEAEHLADGVIIPNLRAVIEDPSWRNLYNAVNALGILDGSRGFAWKADTPLTRKLLPLVHAAIGRAATAELDEDQRRELLNLGDATEKLRDIDRPEFVLKN